MGNKVDNKFTWIIKNFSSLQSEKIYSDPFVIGGCKWHLLAYPKGKEVDESMSLFLEVDNYGSLPSGWRRHALFRLSVENQKSSKLSLLRVAKHWFVQKSPNCGYTTMIPLTTLNANNGGFLKNGQVKIVVEVDVLEVIEETRPFKKLKMNDDGAIPSNLPNPTQQLNGSIVVKQEREVIEDSYVSKESDSLFAKESSMGNKVDNKFTWVISNFSSLESEKIYSVPFFIGGCEWHLLAYPKGKKADDCLSLFLEVDDCGTLPSGWSRHALFRLSIVNQKSEKLSILRVAKHWFNQTSPNWGYTNMIPLTTLHENNGGFMRNGQVKIVVEVDVLEVNAGEAECFDVKQEHEVIGQSDVPKESEDGDLNKETSSVNGVEVLASQVDSVRCIFEKHPDTAIEFQSKNPHLRTGYMNILLSLIQKLCKSPQELSNDDLCNADAALVCMKDLGFKLDWLEKKLDQVKENKKKEEACLARLQETEEQLEPLKQKCLDLEAQADKDKADLLEARAPLSFDYLTS